MAIRKYPNKITNFKKAGIITALSFIMVMLFLFLWFGESDKQVNADLNRVYLENNSTESIFKNTLLTGCEQNDSLYELCFMWNGVSFSYPCSSDISSYTGEIADVTINSGVVVSVGLKRNKIKGKVVAVSETEIEIDEYGTFEFAKNFQMYSVVDEYRSMAKQEIILGYENQEFIIEDGKICAAVNISEFDPEKIRVLLKTTGYTSIFHETVSVTSDENFLVWCGDSEILVNKGETIEFNQDSLYFADGRIYIYPVDDGEIYISSICRNLKSPGYEGIIELSKYDEGIVIINEINLEDYLTRVVPSEMPPSYGLEAAKVQAVCARSFAYRQIKNASAEFGVYSEYGAHVDDSISFQVYNNSGENEISTRAVLETSGEIMCYEGNIIGTYYFSTSCGVTTDSGIWNNNPSATPYLTSRIISTESLLDNLEADYELMNEETFRNFIMNYDPTALEAEFVWYRWSFSADLAELSRRINEKLQQCISDSPQLILVKQPDGSFTQGSADSIGELTGLSIVSRGSGGIASQLLIEGTEATVLVIKQGNIRKLLGDSSQIYSNGLANNTSGTSILPSAFICLEEIYENGILTGYTVYGGGNGHGVGMSQNGAKKLADAGYTYKQILEFFYSGAYLSNFKL